MTTSSNIDREAVQSNTVGRLRARRAELVKRFGVRRIGIFGSFARGDAGADSDLDVLVEFEPEAATYDHLFDLHTFLRDLFDRDIDIVTADGLSPHVRPYVEDDLIWA